MVCTRSKARQKAAAAGSQSAEEDVPQTVKTSARSARKTRRKSAAQLQEARDLNSDAGQTSGSRCIGGGEDGTESIEELALRAFRVMKERLEEEEGLGEDDRGEMEMDTNTRLDVMTLETKPDTMKEAVPGKLRRLSGVLPTSLQPRMEETPYFSYSRKKGLLGPLTGKAGSLSWGEGEEELMKKSVITSDFEKRDAAPPMHVSKHTRDKARREAREKSAGSGWFEMKAPQMTPELQNDLKLLRMRNALNPSQHYKGSDWNKLPRYFQVGKIVSGPAEFYSSRVPKRERKQTIMDELLHDHQFRKYHKKKYSELQRKFASGARRKRFIKHKKHYKK